jgi:uncharacterized protein YeaO (DUF488 family)
MAARRIARRRRAAAPATEVPAEFSSPACYMHELAAPGATAVRGVVVKRIYEAPAADDGYRVLVDRLWPRGVSKQRAALDAWRADLAPSAKLREWYHQDERRWNEFRRRYRAELRAHAADLDALRERAAHTRVTLLYASHDAKRNHALVLREVLEKQPRARTRRPRPP